MAKPSFSLSMRSRLTVDKAIRPFRKDIAAAMYAEAVAVLNVSQKLVPVDTGFLKSTGHVDLPKLTLLGIEVAIGYGAIYAARVHEDLNARHTNGQAKYLSEPLEAAAAGLDRRVAARVREARR